MSIIQVKFDNTLKQSDIIIPLHNSSQAEAQETYIQNKPEVQQTLVYGIQAPLIMVNNIVVDFSDVISFDLTCDGVLPAVSIRVRDRYNLSTIVDTPGVDNELRVQILPKFEDKYKKINLSFYMTDISIEAGLMNISAVYKLPLFTSSQIKSFGEISLYKLVEQIAQETGLGFATNIVDNNDLRFAYCPNISYRDLLDDEMRRSCTMNGIYEYWIDWWNNLVLADVKERYNAVDKDEDMQIWIANQQKEMTEGSEIQPTQTVASFHNNPAMKFSELYVTNYKICNSPGSNYTRGTDRVFSIYERDKTEYMDHLIQDGDTKKDIFTQFSYLGEVYGQHNYFLSNQIHDTFHQKINTNEMIEIELRTPLLGVMRGNRVNFLWYTNDKKIQMSQKSLKDMGVMNESLETNIPLDNGTTEPDDIDGQFILDNSISGQYLVTECKLTFAHGIWNYIITLARPTSSKPKILKEENE